MALKHQPWQPAEVRKKIPVTELIERLTQNVLSAENLLTPSQVTSAKILLGKAIPDLKAIEHSGNSEMPIVHRIERRIVKAEGDA